MFVKQVINELFIHFFSSHVVENNPIKITLSLKFERFIRHSSYAHLTERNILLETHARPNNLKSPSILYTG